MDIAITNLTSSRKMYSDIGVGIDAGATVTVKRRANEISGMQGLMKAIQLAEVSVALTPTAEELASGLLAPPQAVQAADLAPVASSAADAPMGSFFKAFAAAAAGAPDDVTIFAVNTLPFKIRVFGATALVSTAIGASTLSVRSAAGGGGTEVAALDSATTGFKTQTAPLASVVLTPGAAVGLFVRRSDRGVAGEVNVLWRRES